MANTDLTRPQKPSLNEARQIAGPRIRPRESLSQGTATRQPVLGKFSRTWNPCGQNVIPLVPVCHAIGLFFSTVPGQGSLLVGTRLIL
jgi:hypothetical protein